MPNSTTKSSGRGPWRHMLCQLAVIFFWLLVWHLVSLALGQPILLVSPLKVLERLGDLVHQRFFWISIVTSLQRIMLGFVLSTVCGILLAAAAQNRLVYRVVNPLLSLIRATPVASFTILVLFWVHSRYLAVVISFLMVLPIIFYNVHEGLANTDPKLLEMAHVFRLSRWKRIRAIYLPSAWPYFLSAFSIALGQAWKSGIAAEVIALPNDSIGLNLYNAKITLENADLLAWTAVIVLLSVLIEQGFRLLIRFMEGRR